MLLHRIIQTAVSALGKVLFFLFCYSRFEV
jgi:hypothetical protein